MQETPTWTIRPSGLAYSLIAPNGEYVASLFREGEAAEIARKLAAHDALVAALERAKYELGFIIRQSEARGYGCGGPRKAFDQVAATLKLA